MHMDKWVSGMEFIISSKRIMFDGPPICCDETNQIGCPNRGRRWPSALHHVSWPWLYKKIDVEFLFIVDPTQGLCPKSFFFLMILGH